MSAPVNDASFHTWMAIKASPSNPALYERAAQWIETLLAQPEVNPNTQFEFQSLLTLSLRAPTKDKSALNESGTRFLPSADERVSTAVLARGANPWDTLTSHQRQTNKQPMWVSMRLGAWGTLQAILDHPARPAWDALLLDTDVNAPVFYENIRQRPVLAQVLLLSGLDPNWTDSHHRTLLYQVSDPDIIAWCVAHGADPHHLDNEGHTPLAHQDKQGKMSAEVRMAWTMAMQGQGISPDFVWKQATTGKMAKVNTLFLKKEDRLTWRWRPDHLDVEVNLLDAAALAAIQRPSNLLNDTAKSEPALLNQLLKATPNWPIESLQLAELAWTFLDPKMINRLADPYSFPATEKLPFEPALARFAKLGALHPELRAEQFKARCEAQCDALRQSSDI